MSSAQSPTGRGRGRGRGRSRGRGHGRGRGRGQEPTSNSPALSSVEPVISPGNVDTSTSNKPTTIQSATRRSTRLKQGPADIGVDESGGAPTQHQVPDTVVVQPPSPGSNAEPTNAHSVPTQRTRGKSKSQVTVSAGPSLARTVPLLKDAPRSQSLPNGDPSLTGNARGKARVDYHAFANGRPLRRTSEQVQEVKAAQIQTQVEAEEARTAGMAELAEYEAQAKAQLLAEHAEASNPPHLKHINRDDSVYTRPVTTCQSEDLFDDVRDFFSLE